MREKITRRRFVENLILTTGAAVAFPRGSVNAEKAALPDLVISKGEMLPALGKALDELGGIGRFVKQGAKVVIKPNISFSSGPDVGANTHPALVAEVARRCFEAGAADILVCDYPLRSVSACLKGSGIQEALEGIPTTRLIYFTEKKFFEKVDVPNGESVKGISILKPVLESDVLINMPIAKTHGGATVTMALKNLMGIIWERKFFHVRYDLNQAIADLATLIKPQLTILDAHCSMVEGGPGGPGKLEYTETIIAGTNQLEVDALGVGLARWYGKDFTAREIPHLFNAYRLGLGEIDREKLKYREIRA